jgi:transposase
MEAPETITISKAEFDELVLRNNELALRNEKLTLELAELKRLIFGARSERFKSNIDTQQGSLFAVEAEPQAEPQQQQISYSRQAPKEKKHPLRAEIPAHLPRREEVIEPDNIPEGAKRIGETVTEILEYEPGNVYVRRIIRPKYLTASSEEGSTIVVADLPSLPIPKGNAGPSFLAHIQVSKYTDHLPFYRQRQMLMRQGLDIAESSIGGWHSATCRLIDPLYETLRKQVLATDYVMADETPYPVQTKDKPGATHKGYLWVYCDPVHRLALFDYQKSRGREGPNEMLANFNGFLQTDGYAGYNNLITSSRISSLACMAHARRKFEHARDNDQVRASHALGLFQKLYQIERNNREAGLNNDQIREIRQENALPILKELEQWMRDEYIKVTPKSPIGAAIAYTTTLWPRLLRYTEQGRFQIDNNLIENTIRPVAVGRKNYLFAGSHEAAQNAAMMYSLLATAKLNEVEPLRWLTDVLTRIQDYPANKLADLLPIRK